MRSAHVTSADRLPNMPNQDVGAQPVIQITTDLPGGGPNTFYIDPVDIHGQPVKTPIANQPQGAPVDPEAINLGDPIAFDIAAGPIASHHEAEWKGRRFRQRGYSFDDMPTQVEIPTTERPLVSAPDGSLLGKLGLD